MKLLITITGESYEKSFSKIYKTYKLPFVLSLNGNGSASNSMMSYFGISEIKRIVLLSLIPDNILDDMLFLFNRKMDKPGSGIVFSIPVSGGPKYMENIVGGKPREEVVVMKNNEYSLIVTIVSEGYSDTVMNAAKKCGASGGTQISGRGLGSKEATKFLGFSIEPEKDVVLNVVPNNIKNKVMTEILNDAGLNTPGRGLTFSLPIDKTAGFGEMDAKIENI